MTVSPESDGLQPIRRETVGNRVPPIIALLTDFGLQDEYVGVLKGVILSELPHALIVDISHNIPPQNVLAAAAMIEVSHPFFPKGTIHLIVVDPGVGTKRRLIALRTKGQLFLAPDNGVLTSFLDSDPIDEIRTIDQPAWYLPQVGATFHGRDILAPVAARIAGGAPFDAIGPPIDPETCIRLPHLRPRLSEDGVIIGTILHIDRFGNLITNITRKDLDQIGKPQAEMEWLIEIGDNKIIGIHNTYGDAPVDTLSALIGSRGCLEIAVNCGDASKELQVTAGETVIVRPATTVLCG